MTISFMMRLSLRSRSGDAVIKKFLIGSLVFLM